MSRALRIAALYALFALVAMAANLLTQWLVVRLVSGSWAIPLSVLAGTVVGLPIKYFLDKKWIVAYVTARALEDVRLLALYTVTAIATTLVCWGTEWLFQVLSGSEALRLLGGAIGLTVGYTAKYFLDRRFVFTANDDDGA